MKDELRQIERMLRRVPLRKPPASLDAKVLPPRRRGRALWATAGRVAAAAVIAIAALLMLHRAPQAKRPPAARETARVDQPFEPVQVEETISRVFYEGLLVPDEKTPVRVFRRRTLQRTWLVDPDSGYSVEMTVPCEHVILVDAEIY